MDIPQEGEWIPTGPWHDVGDERAGSGSLLRQAVERPVHQVGGGTGVERSSRDIVTLDSSAREAEEAHDMPGEDEPVDVRNVVETGETA